MHIKCHIIAAIHMLREVTDRHLAENPRIDVAQIRVRLLDGIIMAVTAAQRVIAMIPKMQVLITVTINP